MPKQSAGLLLYRRRRELEFMLIHPGGPFWKNKEKGAWSIPKGEFDDGEDALEAAKRELKEETGFEANGEFIRLVPIKQKGGKLVHAWAVQQDVDLSRIESNSFEMEWPPSSGKTQTFPEVDKAAWYNLEDAKEKINPAQISLLDQLAEILER